MTVAALSATHGPVAGAIVRTAGGRFDRTDGPVFFVASDIGRLELAQPYHPYLLIAVNELFAERTEKILTTMLDDPRLRVMLDSGIFWLTNRHKRAHNITMDEALALPPEAIDGFDELFARYCTLVDRYADRLWGYVELDQGGVARKRITRADLEARGYRPMPVYHPLNDGWDYFDELASRYDRICVGNLVQAEPPLRKRLIATVAERRRAYPHLWIHLLGVTPSQLHIACPQMSCDSSQWLAALKWISADADTVALQNFDALPEEFAYEYGADRSDPMNPSNYKAAQFAAVRAAMRQRNWRNLLRSYAEAGLGTFSFHP